MVKLQIKIYDRQRERVREDAHKKEVSIAEIMRRLIDKEYFPGIEKAEGKIDNSPEGRTLAAMKGR